MCSCGETEPHQIATKTTLDGRSVEIWSDGGIGLAPWCSHIEGVGRRKVPGWRLWTFAEEVCLYTLAELGGLVTAHQRAPKPAKAVTRHAEEWQAIDRGERFNAAATRGRPLRGPLFY